MPIIQLHNWPSAVRKLRSDTAYSPNLNNAIARDNEFMTEMSDALRNAAMEAAVPMLNQLTFISVSFDAGHVPSARPLADDKTCIIVVSAIFTAPERTKDVRDRLAMALLNAAKKHLMKDWVVEVFVHTFDPSQETFFKG